MKQEIQRVGTRSSGSKKQARRSLDAVSQLQRAPWGSGSRVPLRAAVAFVAVYYVKSAWEVVSQTLSPDNEHVPAWRRKVSHSEQA